MPHHAAVPVNERAHRDEEARRPAPPVPADQMLDLQRSAGNQAVARMLRVPHAQIHRTITITDTGQTYDDVDAVLELIRGGREDTDPELKGDRKLIEQLMPKNPTYADVDDLLAKIKERRPGLTLTSEYWKWQMEASASAQPAEPQSNARARTRNQAPAPKTYADTQTAGFWNTYTSTKGRGGDRKLDDVIKLGPELLQELQKAAKSDPGKLKLYRGMDIAEATEITRWVQGGTKGAVESGIQAGSLKARDLHPPKVKAGEQAPPEKVIPVKHHLAGASQATFYYTPNTPGKALVEFTLKPGAHKVMFNPTWMAAGYAGKGHSGMAQVVKDRSQQPLPKGSDSEGELGGHIGVKAEQEGPFSLSLGDHGGTKLLFQLLLESVRIVPDTEVPNL